MEGICNITNEFNQRESTMDLRSDLVSQLETTNTLISSNREIDLDEKKQISATITDLE